MRLTKYIILFTVLTLTTFLISPSKAETCTTNDLGDRTCTTSTAGTTTGNVLTNSTFTPDGSGNYNHGWTSSGDIGHGHPSTSGTTYTGQNTSGGVLAFEGDPSGSIYQDVDLVGDGHLTKSQINEGFTSTMSTDVWFWNNVENTLTLKQTITDDNGNVITQKRDINDYDPNRAFNGGQWTNYTDSAIINSNTQAEYTIRTEVYNNTAGTNYDGSHWGPDVDNVELSITTAGSTTTTFTPCEELGTCTDAGEAINDATNLTTDDGMDLFQDLDNKVDEAIEFVKVEDLTEDFKVANIETTIIVEDLDGKLEEFKIEDYAVQTFNNFIEANDLTETFETALIEEDLGKEEFFDVMSDSIKEEFGEEFDMGGDDFKEDLTTEGGPSDITNETVEEETVETETNTTDLKESNDTTTETKVEEESNETISESKDSENVSNESDVDKNTETEGTETETDNEEAVEDTTNTDVKTDGGSSVDTRSVEKKVERVIAKVLAKLKKVDQKLQAIQFITTQGIKSGEADISGYINKRVYSNQKLYDNVPFYNNLNILEQQQIYKEANLDAYESNDPIAVKQRLTVEIESEISRIEAELYALKKKKEQL